MTKWKKNIKVPVKNEDLTDLKIGDVITLTGNIITARDQAHKKNSGTGCSVGY